MTPLEREMEAMGMLRKRTSAGGGAKSGLTRKSLSETQEHMERARARSAAQEAVEDREYIPVVPPRVRKVMVWTGIAAVAVLVALIASVPWQRTQYTAEELKRQAEAKTDLLCTDGSSRAQDASSFWSWATGGSAMDCSNWETRDASQVREQQHKLETEQQRERAARNVRGY